MKPTILEMQTDVNFEIRKTLT